MKAIWLGENDESWGLIKGKEYEILGEKGKWFGVIDESGDSYMYPKEDFEVTDDSPFRDEEEVKKEMQEKGQYVEWAGADHQK